MKNLDKAWDHFHKIQKEFNELDSYFEEIEQISETLDPQELGRWKVLLKQSRDFFKKQKGHLGNRQKTYDRKLMRLMVNHGLEVMDIDGQRLRAKMKGYFAPKKGFEEEAPTMVVVDKKMVSYLCEAALKSGHPLPRYAREYLEPVITVRKIKS